MMCSRPYVRTPTGVTPISQIGTENRLACTPFPCGRCLGCEINKARIWKSRILLEQRTNPVSSFVTLTYTDEKVPRDHYNKPILHSRDLTNWLKRIRRRIEPLKLRYFAVGEYGKLNWRPHFHIALFNVPHTERKLIEQTWQKGFNYIGDLNSNSAAYIVGYCTEKIAKQKDLWQLGLPKEFQRSSKKNGGLGYDAVMAIAKEINKSAFMDKKAIRQIAFGTKNLPLGTYLTTKLAEAINVSPEQLNEDFQNYQEEIFINLDKGEDVYYDKILGTKKEARHSQKKRTEIFRRSTKI